MALPMALEVERLMNLIRNFGWDKVKEETVGDKLVVTIQRTIEVKPVPTPT